MPLTDQPTAKVQLRDWSDPTPESAPYADATTPTPPEPQPVEPPAGTEPKVPVDNRKLVAEERPVLVTAIARIKSDGTLQKILAKYGLK